jgi:hypothetical protein
MRRCGASDGKTSTQDLQIRSPSGAAVPYIREGVSEKNTGKDGSPETCLKPASPGTFGSAMCSSSTEKVWSEKAPAEMK